MFVMGLLLNLPSDLVGLIWGSFGICSRFLELIMAYSNIQVFLVICLGSPQFSFGVIFARGLFRIQVVFVLG